MGIARLCKEFSCLPLPGGLFHQTKHSVIRLEAVVRAWDMYDEYLQKKPPQDT